MILYNMRYRGPYEYDKFILNIFQYHNEILRLEQELRAENETKAEELQKKLDQMLEDTDTLANQLLLIRERKVQV